RRALRRTSASSVRRRPRRVRSGPPCSRHTDLVDLVVCEVRQSMSIALVTGGAGFVGSHLVDALLARGQKVRVLDNFSSGTWSNLPPPGPQLEVIAGDLNDLEVLRQAVEGVAVVLHLAAPPFTSYEAHLSTEQWARASETLNVLGAAYKAGVKRVVYSSCESVYGPTAVGPLTESAPMFPISPYAYAK